MLCTDLPGYVCFPAPEGLTEMLKNGPGLVLLDWLRHHVTNVHHDRSTKLKIVVRLNPLLGDSLGYAFWMASLELPREEISQPPFQEGSDSSHEKQPNPPAGSPDTASGTLANWSLKNDKIINIDAGFKNFLMSQFRVSVCCISALDGSHKHWPRVVFVSSPTKNPANIAGQFPYPCTNHHRTNPMYSI